MARSVKKNPVIPENYQTLAPQAGKQELMVNIDVDFMIIGGAAGAAKTSSILLRSLRYYEDPYYNAIYFKRTTPNLEKSLWPAAKEMYRMFNPEIREKAKTITFDSGAILRFNHMEMVKHKYEHQGAEYTAVFFDELTHFEEEQVTYLMSRLRSNSKAKSFMIGTCNPDADSWVLKWVDWYLDKDGYPDPKKVGKKRFYLLVDGSPKFAATSVELERQYPDNCWTLNPNTGERIHTPPKTFTCILANIFDNPKMIESNPNYLSELKSLPEVERARLLDGNWYIRPQGSNYFERGWLRKAALIPPNSTYVRAWDKASSEPSEKERRPDYTASIGMAKSQSGDVFIYGNWAPDQTDADMADRQTAVFGKFRKRPGERDRLIMSQAEYDGEFVTIVLSKDGGGAGESEFLESAKKLIQKGFIVKPDPLPTNQSKLTKFTPFSAACQTGIVYIVEDSFPNVETLNAFYKELESFDGTPSTRERKDDWVDVCSSAFNHIVKERVLPEFVLPDSVYSNRYSNSMSSSHPSFGDNISSPIL